MRVWRIDRRGRDPIAGVGGLHSAGRWHPKGFRVSYTSTHLSLAILEKLVHVDPDLIPDGLAAFEIDLPDDQSSQEVLPVDQLPSGWRSEPPLSSTQNIGRAWLTEPGRRAILVVPSAVVPSEHNWLLNPRHPSAKKWKVVAREAFRFDPRLVRGG
jgi:RES domain-containing protein